MAPNLEFGMNDDHNHRPIVRSGTAARQGETSGICPMVLAISLTLTIIAMVVIYFVV
jgi:hypothetical protein